ncbi:MAG: hypothetical protein GYA43_11550 [Bacteroidales bacterium]|nr:hypothetical protein [Bacteroidales bacterium]
MKKCRVFLVILCAFLSATMAGQTYIKPFYSSKTPETIELLRMETSPQSTTLYLSIENRIAGGYFCTDRRTYLYLPDKTKLRLTKASGIPYCPELHKFLSIGEKLQYELVFPPLPEMTKFVDLVEECGANCYAIYGIIPDNELTARLERLFSEAEANSPGKNMLLFIKFLEENTNPGINGLLYVNIINAAVDAGNKADAEVWYRRLVSSDVPRRDFYIRLLNEKGIKF